MALNRLSGLKCCCLLFALSLGLPSAVWAQGSEGYYNELERNAPSFWPKDRLPLRVFFRDASGVASYRPIYRELVLKALAQWCAIPGSGLSFIEVAKEKEANFVVAFTGDRSRMNNVHEGGQALIAPDNLGILGAEITFLTVPSQPNLETLPDPVFAHVALHEVGHALGISGHSPSSSDVMYPSYTPATAHQVLSQADKDTLKAVYAHPLKATAKPATLDAMHNSGVPADAAQRLNFEAAKLMQEGKLNDALLKMEEAHRLNPDNALTSSSLATLYCNLGTMAQMMRQYPLAESYFKKALPLFTDAGNKQGQLATLKAYFLLLMICGREQEAKVLEAKFTALSK